MLTLGSLFDGIGGFPLSGAMHGIKPIWASEIEPFPILVTSKRFPEMRHAGSVTDIKGDQVEPVDILTFGSPCQDLSVAGAQKGIHEGARSSLFFEAVRIIKEMRNNDKSAGRTGKHVRPRFAVWENVPGAYSSNKGRDFQAVLQALCEVADPGVHVPFPQGGRWQKAGCIVGDGYSVAWRTLDAQYFPRTPQRRKRIYLVADFGSERAGEILFKPHSMRGNPEEGEEAREGAAEDAQGCAGGSCFAWTYRGRGDGCNVEMQREIGYALREPSGGGSQPNVVYPAEAQTVVYAIEGNGQRESHNGDGWAESDQMYTLNTVERHAVVYDARGNGNGGGGTDHDRRP
jgi:DNA (cytosine-5)-methyltransferase 1